MMRCSWCLKKPPNTPPSCSPRSPLQQLGANQWSLKDGGLMPKEAIKKDETTAQVLGNSFATETQRRTDDDEM